MVRTSSSIINIYIYRKNLYQIDRLTNQNEENEVEKLFF